MAKSKLNELVKELYQVKEQLWDLTHKYGKSTQRRELMLRKDELLLLIKEELKKVGKAEAQTIRAKLREDLAIIIL